MTEAGDSTAAAESGGDGAAAQGTPGISVTIPETLAGDENFKGFFKEENGAKRFDFEGFTKSYIETKQALPAVPETADAYKFEFPKGFQADEADVKLQREMAKQAGLTQAQYESVVKYDMARMARAAEQGAKQAEECVKALKSEWKDKFDSNLALAEKAARALFGADFTTADPAVVKGLLLVAHKMGEDTLKLGGLPAGDRRPLGEDGKRRLKFKSMGD